MKTFLCVVMSFVMLLNIPVVSPPSSYTELDEEISVQEVYENYVIFDENGNYLTEKRGVVLGDIIIDKDFNEYEVIFIDDATLTAKARFVQSLEKPKVHKKEFGEISAMNENKSIGLYSTHNDESYIIGDGVESVYGAGGIHDIANMLASSLREKNIKVTYNETLHIPHNSSAYTRSRKTAESLLKDGATAIFDIHRDGASRSFYLTNHEGKNYSKVRIVVGQANPNKDANLKFALWLVSVAESLHPWLIADIYYGKGKYNQDLSSKALLFEMGCHKIEKEYVKRTVPVLSEVINATLFATTVEEETGNLIIGGTQTENQGATVDEVLEQENLNPKVERWFFVGTTVMVVVVAGFVVIRKFKQKNKVTSA